MYRRYFKRFLDIAISFTALLCLSPLLIIVTLWLTIANKGGGAFFTQERPGKDERIFKIIKFKSMTDERDKEGRLLPDAERLTRAGRFVRSTSIDELPQLINVLKGDMSLIGPRPLLAQYLLYYTKRESLRHTVRPGITGWAQVNGRNFCSWDTRLEHDAYYVEHISLMFDLKIVIKTIENVLSRKDIEVAPSGEFLDIERQRNIVYNIRQIETSDLEERVTWMNNPTVYSNMTYQPPITLENTYKWYERVHSLNTRVDMVLTDGNGKRLAFAGLINVDDRVRKAEFYLFVNPERHRMGHGVQATFLLCKYGFDTMQLNKIYLYTNATNIGARKVYERVGFRLEGMHRAERYCENHYEDRCYYGLLASEFDRSKYKP